MKRNTLALARTMYTCERHIRELEKQCTRDGLSVTDCLETFRGVMEDAGDRIGVHLRGMSESVLKEYTFRMYILVGRADNVPGGQDD